MKLTNQKVVGTISTCVEVYTYRNGKKYVTLIETPYWTKILTYKTEREQAFDTIKRMLYLMKSTKGTLNLSEHGRNMSYLWYEENIK